MPIARRATLAGAARARLVLAGMLLGALLLALSCGNGDEASGPADGQSRAALIITQPGSIVQREIPDGDERALIVPDDPRSFLLDAMPSPDGSRIAYVVQPPVQLTDGMYDAGTDIWIANRDGSEPRQVYEHNEPNQLARFPQWQDETTLLAIVTEMMDEGGQTYIDYTLSRIDIETGERTRIMTSVLAFGVSPDGRRVAYSRLLEGGREALHVAAVDGTDDAELVGPGARLQPIRAIRFSPDGSTIAFASAEQPEITRRALPVSFGTLSSLNGLPEDIWTVPASGGEVRLAADLKEDLPTLTWSDDGSRIYVLGSLQLYELDVDSGEVEMLGPGVPHGEVAWIPEQEPAG